MASKDYNMDEQRRPCVVVACGYKQLRTPRAGNMFPAWLVCIPHRDPRDNNQRKLMAAQATPSPNSSLSKESCYCVWRTKRDFLLLHRPASKLPEDNNNKSPARIPTFPKAAFQKLCNRSPWSRPRTEYNPLSSTRDDRSFVEQLNDFENNYHVSMKKNIQQLDQFLSGIYMAIQDDDARGGLSREHLASLQDAWEIFCRPQDSDNLLNLPKAGAGGTSTATFLENSTEKLPTPQSLGQYFCTDENATQLVQLFLRNLPLASSKSSEQHLVILEPSCGHGDVVSALLKENPLSVMCSEKGYSKITVLALDVDPRAIAVCRQRLADSCTDADSPSITTTTSTTVHKLDGTIELTICCTDFLESMRRDYINGGNDRHVEGTNSDDSNTTRVVAIGGPPYGCHHNERDLPIRFVQHCIQAWRADMVAFLVPQRFPEALPDNNTNAQRITDEEVVPMSSFTSECEALPSSTFYFQGKTPVTQPSRLQCWFRKDEPRSLNVITDAIPR